ncbi:hypothetical protein KGM_206591 [Danaus plexippus plexippus]|uniref:Uncharacterized protein n=1 Tax=Danaus plexippus plexippus TaxID=278856 RepID=A0A212F2E1_DANPL|nr:hypothetical protein KGM_206591 [Danaus plexippus plexippus]
MVEKVLDYVAISSIRVSNRTRNYSNIHNGMSHGNWYLLDRSCQPWIIPVPIHGFLQQAVYI